MNKEQFKAEFKQALTEFVGTLKKHISTPDDQWTVKGFIDLYKDIYTISADTKMFPKLWRFIFFQSFLNLQIRITIGLF